MRPEGPPFRHATILSTCEILSIPALLNDMTCFQVQGNQHPVLLPKCHIWDFDRPMLSSLLLGPRQIVIDPTGSISWSPAVWESRSLGVEARCRGRDVQGSHHHVSSSQRTGPGRASGGSSRLVFFVFFSAKMRATGARVGVAADGKGYCRE